MTQATISSFLSRGWETFKQAPWRFIGFFLLFFIISGLSSTVFDSSKQHDAIMKFAFLALDALVQALVMMLITNFVLASVSRDPSSVTLRELWTPDRILDFVVLWILSGIIYVVGFMLFILPGLVAMVLLMFSPYFVVDHRMHAFAAIRASFDTTKVHFLRLLAFLFVMIVINVLGVLAFGIGALITMPITTLAMGHAYRTLSGAHEGASSAPGAATA